VEQVLAAAARTGHVVILDNLSAHKVPGVRQLIEERGAQLLDLPPYSPDFNPIEQAWSKLKQRLRGVKARVRTSSSPPSPRLCLRSRPRTHEHSSATAVMGYSNCEIALEY
jgi:transposase